MSKLQQDASVTYGDALERVGIKFQSPFPDGMYQTVCHKCDFRTRCAASKFYKMALTAVMPVIQRNGYCKTYTRNGYNPSGYHRGRVA